MSKESERWLAESRAWLDEQMEAQRVRDEAAFVRFRQTLLGPFDEWTGDFER